MERYTAETPSAGEGRRAGQDELLRPCGGLWVKGGPCGPGTVAHSVQSASCRVVRGSSPALGLGALPFYILRAQAGPQTGEPPVACGWGAKFL